MRKLIAVIIPTEWEVLYPNEVREFLDRFEVIRRAVIPDMDGTVYQLKGENFPEVPVGSVLRMVIPKVITGDFMRIIYI
jgi:hypothetical protein